MTTRLEPAKQHSTLELVKHDTTADAPELVNHDATTNAPEHDHAITTFELDATVLAPQVAFHIGPHTAYDNSPPEVLNEENTQIDQTVSTVTTVNDSSKRKIGIFLTILIITTVAAGIGIGIGIKLGRKGKNPSNSDGLNSAGVSIVTMTQTAMTSVFGPNPRSSDAPALNRRIFNNTSLAALSLSNGDRRLFFQDYAGFIRQAVYDFSTKEWNTDFTSSVASNAMNNTPLSVVGYNSSTFFFYISVNNFLTRSIFHDSFLKWNAWHLWIATPKNASIMKITAPENPTKLMALAPPGGPNPSNDSSELWFFFENQTGAITLLNFSADAEYLFPRDITTVFPQLKSILERPHTSFGPVIGPSNRSFVEREMRTYVRETIYTGKPLGLEAHPNSVAVGVESVQQRGCARNSDNIMFEITTLFPFGVCVNGTKLVYFGLPPYPQSIPDSAFPFTELAAAYSGQDSKFYLYHQLNDDTFLEEKWDGALGLWRSGIFSIST